MTENKIRYARVSTRRDSAESIARYLPANYQIVGTGKDHVIVAGQDNSGWTMDAYLIPRLGSGLISAYEIPEDEARLTIGEPTEADLDTAWSDAYYIADVGASNPKGVQYTLDKMITERHIPLDHPALRAIGGHLDYLQGRGLGPELDDLREVQANARRLGLIHDDGSYCNGCGCKSRATS